MKAFLWRVLYAVLLVFMFFWIAPLFAAAVGFPVGGAMWQLLRAVIACIAVLYVIWGPAPPAPF